MIKYPTFKDPPKTDCADVPENIDNWINKKDKEKIELFLRPSTSGHMGYRFITREDLTETIRTEQWFKRRKNNVCIEFIFIRHYHQPDISFCPLYFAVNYTTVIMKNRFGDEIEVYRSDAQLKRLIKSIP